MLYFRHLYSYLFWGVIACTHDLEDARHTGDRSLAPRSYYLVHIEFDLELTTLVKTEGQLDVLDQIVSTPMLSRQHIDFKVDDAGNVRIEVIELTDSRAALFEYGSPPSDLPVVAKTLISGDQMFLFTANGTLIATQEVEPIPVPGFVDLIEDAIDGLSQQGIDYILSCMTGNMPIDTLMAFINNPPAGVTVQTLTSDIVSILFPLPAESYYPEDYSSVHLVDITNKRLLGSRLYDDQDKILMCRMYNYDECGLKAFKEESYEELPSGQKARTQTIGIIEDLAISIIK